MAINQALNAAEFLRSLGLTGSQKADELGGLYDERKANFEDNANRQALYADERIPERFRNPEAIARANAALPPTEQLPQYANLAETALSGAGQTAGLLGDSVGAFVPQWVEDTLGKAGELVMSTDVGQKAGELILDFSKENPRASENLGNVFNAGSLVVGGGLVKSGATANKGAWAAGVKNYIDNFYGNDKPDVDPSKLEKTLGRIALKFKGASTTDTNVAMAGKKITGLMKWGAGGAASAIDSLFNPVSRGLYKETGISRKGQKAVNDLLLKNNGKPTDRDLDKAVAQVIFNRHLIEQSDRQGEIGSPLLEIEDFSNLQGYKPDTLENFRKGAAATKFTTPDGKQRRTASTVIDTAYAKINKAWGNKTDSKRKIVFKEPSGGRSGDHLKDLAFKHPANKHIRKVISEHKGTLSVEELWKKLKVIADKEKTFQITQTLDQVKKEGLWVQSGMKGTAVVEGGVNGLMKILPNGRAIGFMSDKHDFLEKLPVVGKFLEKALPRELMAVSGPMHMDIMGTRWAEQALEKAGKKIVKREKSSPNKRDDRPDINKTLEDYVSARPTAYGVARGFDPLTGTGLMAATTGNEE